jgi:ABC-2 type transport system ATP-binding protein
MGKSLEARIDEVLERFGLVSRSRDLTGEFSGGMQRRVELAKAVLHHPELLVLDEPGSGLDPAARKNFTEYLKELQEREHATILLTTHLLDEAEAGDRIGILDGGSLVALGTPADLKRDIGGDVIVMTSSSPAQLRDTIIRIFNVTPQIVGETVRLERESGHQFVPQLVGALPGLIDSIHLSKPTLEDVFLHKSGHTFWNGAKNE